MKNFYIRMSSKFWKVLTSITMVMMLSMLFSNAFGQELIWKGGTDNDASKAENWDPVGDYFNMILKVDTAYAPPVWPRFTGPRQDTIVNLVLSNLAEATFAKPDSTVVQLNMPGKDNYILKGTINVESGKFRSKNSRNFYMEDSLGVINLSGTAYFEVPHLTIMAKMGQGRGGSINISDDATFWTKDIIRFSEDSTMSIITITDNGKMIVTKDYRDEFATRIKTGQLRSDEDNDIKIDFDVLTSTVTLTTRSKDDLVAFPSEPQEILSSEESLMVHALQNRGYESLTDVSWKYSTTSGSGYQAFSPALTGDTVSISFETPGMYYVVFEGKKDGNTVVSSEVAVSVAPNYVKLDLTEEQFLRKGLTGATISCLDQVTVTSREWKYTTTSGEGYVSFDDPVTGLEYTPSFPENGLYYLVCEYVYNGQTYTTKEVVINVANHAFEIFWNGSKSDDAYDPRNWSPMATIQWMTLTVPTDATVIPKITGSVNDTINYINGDFIIEKDDTTVVNFRKNGWYITGAITINSGTVQLRQTRLDRGSAQLTLNNNAKVSIDHWLIMGNSSAPTNGGRIVMTGNSTFQLAANSNDVWRWVANNDSLSSLYIANDAVFSMPGNFFNQYSSLVQTGDLFTEEGSEIVVNYNETDDITSIYTRSASDFGLADYSDLVVGVGLETSELSTINNESIISYEWKYTVTPGSGYMSFDSIQTDSVCSPMFSEPNIYYVVCQGFDGEAYSTTDEVKILAVKIEVSPSDTQELALLETGEMLTVAESTTADTREWKVSTTSGSGYEAIFPPATGLTYAPIFVESNGTYYIVCESMINGTAVLSNEIVVEVGVTGIEDIDKASFEVYPNPSNGRFFVAVPDAKSYRLSVIDISGRTIIDRDYDNSFGQQELNIDKKGIFIVKVQTEDNIAAKRIIIR